MYVYGKYSKIVLKDLQSVHTKVKLQSKGKNDETQITTDWKSQVMKVAK